MKIESMGISQIKPFEKNAKKHPQDQVEKIARSIKEFGFNQPIVIDQNNEIVVGHGRFLAALELALLDVPVLRVEHLTAEQVAAYRIADNKLNESEWDIGLLNEALDELKKANYDFDFMGFNESEIEIQSDTLNEDSLNEDSLNEDSFVVDELKEQKTDIQSGDLIIIGKHRLYCGDSTNNESFEKLMDGNVADMFFTDPPYGISYKAANFDLIANDDLIGETLKEFLEKAFSNLHCHTKDGAAGYIWHASTRHKYFEEALSAAFFDIKQQIIWAKHMVLGRSDYHWAHEPCFYVKKKNGPRFFGGDRKQKTVWGLDHVLDEEKIESFTEEEAKKALMAAIKKQTLWRCKKDDTQKYLHPTQKPIELAARAIINSCPKNGKIIDCFAGAGAVFIAAERLGVTCYGIEYEPKYCQVIIDRMKFEFPEIKITIKKLI